MLTGKQRAALRSEANGIETIFQIGKGGIDDALTQGVGAALATRELIKLRVLDNSEFSAREACTQICSALCAEPIQVIGSRFVIYKRNDEINAFKDILAF
ncbi:MAG: YhbY family RNA-binding protein [Oscillospiraceae bacterium]